VKIAKHKKHTTTKNETARPMKFYDNSARSMVSEGKFTTTTCIYIILKTHEPKMNKHSTY